MRNMKKAAKLGASAVPTLHPRKRIAVVQVIYALVTNRGQHGRSHPQRAEFYHSGNPPAHIQAHACW